ncbi:hypothetical protein L596_029438 [Steinernema carpocapsae]|uniref:Uncharacterized protein n=1 Tax=Steinernema carpocapsae TaxID=34508 RepID=A0A4U5LUN1_STECR|nr:hypothetical protein L596_029438 [Steinernema carpocapsae]
MLSAYRLIFRRCNLTAQGCNQLVLVSDRNLYNPKLNRYVVLAVLLSFIDLRPFQVSLIYQKAFEAYCCL